MKPYYLLLLLILPLCGIKAQTDAKPITITISQIPDVSVTDAIKKLEKEEILDLKKENSTIAATKYYNLLECGDYTASAKVKNDSIIITVNNSKGCDGNSKYYKLKAVIDNPKNIPYKVWVDPAFTFLAEGERIETFRNHYLLGDINGDKIKDSVTVEYDRVVEANDSISGECGRGTCYMTAKFGNGIPDITESMCYGMDLESLPDMNGDGREEIIMATYYSHGCCHNIYVLSYDGKKWNTLAQANAFNDDESDAARVIKKGRNYYLHYKNWDDDYGDIVEKKKRIKLK
ncbi:hypothetical protein OGH69_04935 [Flavobacterium sp. MFBS3-15]|uniref:hypothetical protein n=1 Tax=Flavobacterium sp. MFBS3-15 TaxID=2989816 RepID=UPI0022354610|nr:hypothetical protein [Flavobacterium sp. MFBS3-15]MCW4468303.1 hypothetical protein [Flavobacterium sp. MFBS3-15]